MHADYQAELFQVCKNKFLQTTVDTDSPSSNRKTLVWEKLLFFTAESLGGSGIEQPTGQAWPAELLFHLQELPLPLMENKKTVLCKTYCSEHAAMVSVRPTARS